MKKPSMHSVWVIDWEICKIITGFIEFLGVTFYIMNVTPKM